MAIRELSKKIGLSLLLIIGLLSFRLVFAQEFGLSEVENNLGGALGASNTDPRQIVMNVVNVVLGFLGLVALIIVLYAGFLWMTSGGEEDKISKAKQILKSGLIGLAIILSAWIIVTFVFSKLSDAVNNGNNGNPNNNYCIDGDKAPCGCGGQMTCANGIWGFCLGSNNNDCLNPPVNCDGSSLPGCQAVDQICTDGFFCDQNCSCKPKAIIGEACDRDISNATCEADNNRCGQYLTCDPTTCLCVGKPVISAISPMGGFCESDFNKPCNKHEDCPAGVACNQETPNGTANNLITILGYNFGSSSADYGRVLFTGFSGDVQAVLPQQLNGSCVNFWSNNQIVIAVPGGLKSGPIKVINYEGQMDSSSDDNGPILPDFIANNIARPGLCSLDPIEASLNKEVNYQGVNLYSGQAYFGNYKTNVSGLYSNFTDNKGLSGKAVVPNIRAGQSGSFVEKNVAGILQKSNYLQFVKEKEAGDGPYIMSFSPTEGASGQYVTIRGAGFGNVKGNSRVYFVSGENKIEASYSFPSVCINSVWSDNQIIVKVPDGLADENYYLEIALKDYLVSSQSSRPNIFSVNSRVPLAPSACKMEPINGPVGTPITFWGEYFGPVKSSIIANFSYNKQASGVVDNRDKADFTRIAVPLESVTGPVFLLRNNLIGNTLNFLVSECSSDSECSNQVCCPAGTYKKGRCVDSLEDCLINIPNSVFEWRFSTKLSSVVDPEIASCLGFAKDFGSCYQGLMCPNSPGACSSPSTNYNKVVGACNLNCNDVPGCTSATCTYNESLDKCVLNTNNNVADCEVGELIAPPKNVDLSNDRYIPRIMYWQGKVNQHWNLSTGAWASDPDYLGAEEDKLAYCQKFYPTTVSVEEYKLEVSDIWSTGGSRDFLSSLKMSYRCILDDGQQSLDLSGIKKTCNQAGQWEIKVKTSCPLNWTRGANNTCFQDDVTCDYCPSNLTCESVNNFNSCVSQKLCVDSKAKCVENTVNDKDDCILSVEPGCDCCCRIGFDAQDCCAPLTCGGTCGSDLTAKPSTNTYGYCSGCAMVGSTQEEWDQACNCLGTSGKFCAVGPNYPQGACTDCANLKTQSECAAHSSTCCFDSRGTATTNDDLCRAIGDSQIASDDPDSPDYGYCGYFNCDRVNPLICSGLPVKIGKYKKLVDCEQGCLQGGTDICNRFDSDGDACVAEPGCCFNYESDSSGARKCISGAQIPDSGFCAYYDCYLPSAGNPYECNPTPTTTGRFKDINICSDGCGTPPQGPGINCLTSNSSTNPVVGQCNFDLCTFKGFQCLQDTGLPASQNNYPSCGTCCCQPADENNPDSCKTETTPDLYCKPNVGNCTGAGRGLCCGCESDSDCGSLTTVGCGISTCCEARPSIISSSPKPSDTNVCRNSAITINFNQKMDTASFIDNFLLFEEKTYGQDVCPAGTFIGLNDNLNNQRLADNNWFKILWYKARVSFNKIFNRQTALATIPSANKLYCSVPGKVSFSHIDNTTSLIFTPDQLLAPAAKYFVLIKGDEALSSNSGVLSAVKVGMNEKGFRDLSSNFINPVEFNGRKYFNGYSFEFTTLANQGARNGICEIDYVKINPTSYLFQKIDNSLEEDDKNVASPSFDSVKDGDKFFIAGAYGLNNQLLFPVKGYNWDWIWTISDQKVLNFPDQPTGAQSNQRLVSVNKNINDGQSKVSAQINMSRYQGNCGDNCNAFFFGNGLIKSSDVYVFSCANPWPAVKSDGTWSPWQDSAANCSGTGVCDNFNYQFYYCRDAGQPGTFDDLPVINYQPVSLSGNLICSTDKSPCSSAGGVCGPAGEGEGVCIWDILKESYFFRDAILSGVEITSLIDTKKGGEVEIKWQSASEGVSAYKIYYLQSGRGMMMSKEFKPIGIGGVCNSDNSGKNYLCSTKIGGLVDGESYIFKISLLSESKTESLFSGERTVKVSDQTPPAAPTGLRLSATENELKFIWNKNSESNIFYRLYYGINPGKYAESFDTAPDVNELSLLRSRFSGSSDYFAVSALDKSKNESPKSTERQFVVFNNKIWLRSLPSEVNSNFQKECLVEMNVNSANPGQAVCSNSLPLTNPGWFVGKFTSESSLIFCKVPGCERVSQANLCGYLSGYWFNRCYMNVQ